MNIILEELFNGISQLESFKNTIQSLSESLKFLGILSFVLILLFIIIVAAVILAPTIISMNRKTKFRKIIIIANLITVLFFLVNFTLPLIIWALLFIVALMGKKELKTTIDIPTIIINTTSSQVNNRKSNRG